jgi:fucose 4-O-acetylase-like acetyltransferase
MGGSVSRGQDNALGLRGRIEWVDAAKGIGIFLVVFGHSLGGIIDSGILSRLGWSAFIVRCIYMFHMPLFFFLAGMFVARSAHRIFHDYFLNKASVIVYHYFLWSILEGSIQYFSSRYTNSHISATDLLKIIFQPIDQFWFLYTIFLMYMTYWLARYWRISNDQFLIFALLLYTIEGFGLNIVRWDVFHSFCSLLIYFALGAKAGETSIFTDLRMLNGTRFLGLAISGYVLIVVAAAMGVSNLPFLHAVLAVAGTVATIALAMLLSSSSVWSSFVKILGVYSLEIYVSHTIVSAAARIAMRKALGYSGPLLHVLVETTVGIGIPLLLAIWGPSIGLPYLFTLSRSRQNTEISAVKIPMA